MSLGAHQASECTPGASVRVPYLDNIKIFLIVLVVLHHVAVGLGAPGVWYIKGPMTGDSSSVILTLFVSVNQAFFMGLFFLIAGYHSWTSFKKYGAGGFIFKRLVRLGIPLALYDLLVNPAIVALIVKTQMTPAPRGSILFGIIERFFTLGSGPAWFLERLLVFSLLFAILMYFYKPAKPGPVTRVPAIIRTWPVLLILVLAGLQFVMKTQLPPTRELTVAGIDFPLFPPRYIAMFLIGIWLARASALEKITYRTGWTWLLISVATTLALYEYVKPTFEGITADSLENGHIIAAALWENTLAVGLSIGVLALFREHVNWTGAFSGALARSSYAAYLCHAPVLVAMAIVIPSPGFSSIAVFLITAPVALVLSFGLGHLLVTTRKTLSG